MATNNIKNVVTNGITVKGTFPVLGMTCAACAGSAESIVQHQDGVVDASVNFATGILTMEYLSDKTDIRKLQKAVQDIGYDLFIVGKTKQQKTLEGIQEEKYKQLKARTTWAVILSLPVFLLDKRFLA